MSGVVRMDGRTGMAVAKFGGYRLAEDHAARGTDQRDAGGVGKRPVAAIDRRTVLGRHVDSIDDILDPDWYAAKRTPAAGSVDGARLGQRLLRIEPCPSLDLGVCGSPIEAGAGQRLGRQIAGRETPHRLGGRQTLETAHGRPPAASRLSTQS